MTEIPGRDAEREVMLNDINTLVDLTRDSTGVDTLSPEVTQALRQVPRHCFVPYDLQALAYANKPLPIGQGQTISQPFIVALMTQLLGVGKHARVLEIGTGCGYQTAVLATMVEQVYSIELVPTLATLASSRLADLGYTKVEVRQGDGYLGWPEQAPYDGIIVTAASTDIPPPLIDQLKAGACMVIPVERRMGQQLIAIRKRADGGFDSRDVLAVAFVPLLRG